MKRSWLGFILLLILLLGGILSSRAMTAIHTPIEGQLLSAADAALEQDWENAGNRFRQAQQSWKQHERFRACFADHNPVEEIDAAFEAADTYGEARDGVSFSAACRSLARQVAAVGEAHELVWWNLL